MRASVRGDEGGVELWLDGQLCGEPTMSVNRGATADKLLNTFRDVGQDVNAGRAAYLRR